MTAPPRDSAAVVLMRNPDRPEVFWVRRSDQVMNQPGFQAFLGGTLHGLDRELEMEGIPEGPARWMRACALREVLEEAGVLLGVQGPTSASELSGARRMLLEAKTDLATLARSHGWRFDGGALIESARWVTPPFASLRYDTWYFLAWLPEDQEARVEPGELASGEWVLPDGALERWRKGEVTFVAPILHTLREVAKGTEGLAERLRSLPEATAHPVRRIEMKWGVVLLPLATRPLPPATHTNCYLVGDREMALIDPGSGEPEQLEQLFALIGQLEAEGRRIRSVLVTHHHPDHTGGVEAVRERFGVPVLAHREAARSLRLDRALDDGDVVPLEGDVHDWTLRAVHTPGHARDHLCFFHLPTHSLFTGDHVVGFGTVVIDPPEGDMTDYMDSLEKLLELPVETLFPAHGTPRGAAQDALRALLEHRRRREARVLAALADGAKTPEELLPRVYDDTPEGLWPWARRSLAAHLEKLVRQGSVIEERGEFHPSRSSRPQGDVARRRRTSRASRARESPGA